MKYNYLIFITFSFLLHLLILSIPLDFLKNKFMFSFSPVETPTKISIDNITLKSFRTVGRKQGKKDLFNPLIKKSPVPPPPQLQPKLVEEIKKSSPHAPIKEINIKKEKNSKGVIQRNYSLNIKDILNEMNKSQDQILPSNSTVNIRVDVPEGVELDELNPLELKFYMFNKRHFESFGLALYKSYSNFLREYPHINLFGLGPQKSVAKVVFYPNGKIDEISILNAADSMKFQHFFQDTVENIHLPNPPQELLIDGKFHVYYTLLLDNE